MIEQKSFYFSREVLTLTMIAGKRIILCIIDHYLHFLFRLSQSHFALRVMKAKN